MKFRRRMPAATSGRSSGHAAALEGSWEGGTSEMDVSWAMTPLRWKVPPRVWPIATCILIVAPLSIRLTSSWLLLALCLAGCKQSPSGSSPSSAGGPANQFLSLMSAGKNYLDQGDATNALVLYKKAD